MNMDGSRRLMVEQVDHVDSTNSELLRREPLLPPGAPAEVLFLVAATQSGGRGRRQRLWLSTPAGSLTASLAREVRRPAHLGALPLVSGLAVAQALEGFGVMVGLKWPNDIHALDGRAGGRSAGKAGGILCEARARGDLTRLVIGVGLNLQAPAAVAALDGLPPQPVAGLFGAGAVPDRKSLALALATALLEATDRWLAAGFAPFRSEWAARDLLLARPIIVHEGSGTRDAVAVGVDHDGALLVRMAGETGGEPRRLLAEEVSIRLPPPDGST